jgi:ribosome maturation protein Sdo1
VLTSAKFKQLLSAYRTEFELNIDSRDLLLPEKNYKNVHRGHLTAQIHVRKAFQNQLKNALQLSALDPARNVEV